jgi:transposase-like protein
MSDFKWRHFEGEFILQCVRWYCKYGISYRDLAEMMAERGIKVHHSTIYRWVQKYAPEMEKRMRWYWRQSFDSSWRVDETCIKVKGQLKYLFRAIDRRGRTVDFYLSHSRNTAMAKKFLCKALNGVNDPPSKINTDKHKAYGRAISMMKEAGKCEKELEHSQGKYLNNRLESDHGKLKLLLNPVRGFKTMKTAFATLRGFELMRIFRKGQLKSWHTCSCSPGTQAEICLINKQFGIYTQHVPAF